MKAKISHTLAIFTMCALAGKADVITYLNNGEPLNSPDAWEGDVVPGANDVVFIEPIVGSLTLRFEEDTAWKGVRFHPTFTNRMNVYFERTGSASLSLGSEGISQPAIGGVPSPAGGGSFTIKIPTYLTADQSWSFLPTATLSSGFPIYLDGHKVWFTSSTTKTLNNSIPDAGKIIVTGGTTKFAGTRGADNVSFVLDGGNLQFEGTYNNSPRAKDIEVRTFSEIYAYNPSNGTTLPVTTEIDGDIVLNGAMLTLRTIQPRANTLLVRAKRLVPDLGMILFKGTELGMNPTNYAGTAKAMANIVFDEVPEVYGNPNGTGDETPIVKGAVLQTGADNFGEGFVAYDELFGVRLLDPATEYAHTIADGQTRLSNVLFTNTLEGPVEITLTQPMTTVNSLAINLTGASGNAGLSILGEPDTTLRVNSGMIFLNQNLAATRTTDDNQTIAVPNLDFNGQEGRIYLSMMAGNSNGTLTPAFNLQSSFTNVSENGVGFYTAGTGTYGVYLNGTQTNTYKGTVAVNKGVFVRLARTATGFENTAILGTLVINGGSCQVLNNQIADDADVIIKSGSLTIKTGATNSGNGGSDDFGSLTLHSGSFTHGGGGGGSTTMDNARMYGGTWGQTRGTRLYINQDLMISGGTITLHANTDKDRSGPVARIYGHTTVSNTYDNMSYVPFAMGYSTVRNCAAIVPFGGFTFVGNNVNKQTAKITITPDPDGREIAKNGEVQLEDEVVFNIIDGAADVELDIHAAIANYPDTATDGVLVKQGEGMLLLSAMTNSLTGGIRVEQGVLGITGLVESETAAVSVEAGATLRTYENTTLNGGLVVEDGANLFIDLTGVLKTASFTGTAVNVCFEPLEEMDGKQSVIISDSRIEADLVSQVKGFHVYKRNGGREAWIGPPPSTLFLIR